MKTGRIDSRSYWNDIEREKEKAYYVTGPDDRRLGRFLEDETSLQRCFTDAVSFAAAHLGGVGPDVLDVASGVCWTTALLSKRADVERVTAVDYSRHRLEEIAPLVIGQMRGEAGKIDLRCGDVMEMGFRPGSFDTVVFCQALYMFDDMDGMLGWAASVLRPGGRVIVACERVNPDRMMSVEFLKGALSDPWYALWFLAVGLGLRPRMDETGRYLRCDSDYRRAIEGAGLEYHFQPLGYPLWEGLPVNSGNYFGRKPLGLGKKPLGPG